jgi:LemA protein
MKNITAIILIVLGLIVLVQGCSTYNGFVDKEENVTNAWSKVESSYQRRADLIPNLVEIVKGYAAHEKETLESVINARAKATSTTIDANNLTPESMAQFQQAQQGLSGALSRLLVTVEKYPDLKANQNFLELQAQLEGTENRIKVARDKFNDVVTVYNKSVKRFPGNLYAGVFGFSSKSTFQAEEGSEKAPDIKF